MKSTVRNLFASAMLAPFAFGLCTARAQSPTPTAPLSNAQALAGLDPDMRNVILIYDAIKGTHLEQLTPQDARQQFAAQDAAKLLARGTGVAEQPTAVGKVLDGLTIPSSEGAQIPIRIYYPKTTGNFPVILYFHGGGFVIATIDTYDESARNLCVDANAIVVSVEYRKAPEHPFPAARQDALNAYRWVLNNGNAGLYGFNGKVAVAGESAGGNLAAEVAIAARNQGLPAPTHQLLIYPETTSNLNQASEQEYTSSVLPLYTAELPYFDAQYLLNEPGDANSPEVAPINANLKGLPPATIIAADEDPLKSDGVDYYQALLAAKDTATYQLYTGTTHEFFGMGAVVAKAKAAEQFGAAQIAASFAQ